MVRPLTPEQLANIQQRAEKYQVWISTAKIENQLKATVRKAGGKPGLDIHVSEEQRRYAEDVPLLLNEIERLKGHIETLEILCDKYET